MTAQQILAKCHKLGVELSSKANDHLEISRSREAITDELREELRRNKADLLEILRIKDTFKTAGFSGTIITGDIDKYLQDQEDTYLWCNYKNIPRQVHPAVCEWHREENDPECAGCDPNKRVYNQKRALH